MGYAKDPEVLREESRALVSFDLSRIQLCDVELILNGSFAPLDGFMTSAECESVAQKKLWRDHFWPVPVVLDVSTDFASQIDPGHRIALRDPEGVLVAVMTVMESFPSPGGAGRELMPVCLGGSIEGVEAPVHFDFKRLRLDPVALAQQFDRLGWEKVLGFATRRPLHQREVYETYNVARNMEANLLINPAVGAVSAEDNFHYARVHALEHALEHYPLHTTDLVLTSLYQRGLGIDDVLLHAIMLKNLGSQYYLVDKEYCDPGVTGLDYDALQEQLSAYNEKLGIELVYNIPMVHSPRRGGYVEASSVSGETINEMSSTEFIERLRSDLEIPVWFSWPEVVDELRKVYKPRSSQGVTIFLTGLSGSGKSSIANALLVKMMEMGGRPITLLDGDIVRHHLSSELGFSKEHRDLNIRRIGYVASQITKHGGMAICAPIAPYRKTRRHVRRMIESVGGFVEVHVSTPLEVCEARDRKGLYAKARAGTIKEFTGISDPYEVPENPELRIDTQNIAPEEAAQRVILTLEKLGYIKLM